MLVSLLSFNLAIRDSPNFLLRKRSESVLGPLHKSNLSCAESNVKEQNPLFELMCIRFDI